MSVRLECSIPDNVVEIGNEVAQGMVDALNAAENPTASNPLLTKSAGDAAYLEKDGGGTVVGTVVVDTDGTVGGNTATITGTSVEVNNFGVGTISIDPVLGITFPDSTSQGTAAPAVVDIQTFGSPTVSGSFTWTKPAGAKMVEVYIFGGGGGAGGGGRYATTSGRGGGGGGGGGTVGVWKISAFDLGETVSVTVGAGGAGGASSLADNSTGAAASVGGDSFFGNYKAAGGSIGAIGGTASGGGGATTRSSILYFTTALSGAGSAGTANSTLPAAAPANTIPLLARGGSGGAGAAANNTNTTNGTAGGTHTAAGAGAGGYTVVVAGGTAGTAATPNGGTGTSSPILLGTGAGGGSGAYRTSAIGGNGGNGGWPSGGGGGGSASDNGFASGAGGSGANGRVIVITYF